MFGPFKGTFTALGGLLWKVPFRMSRFQKRRHRLRMRQVDKNIEKIGLALESQGKTLRLLEALKQNLPKESEMPPKDKYWVFSRKARGYRKGAHLQPKWTRITNRVPPPGF